MGFFFTPSTQSSEGCGRVTESAELPNVPRGLAMVPLISHGTLAKWFDLFEPRFFSPRV